MRSLFLARVAVLILILGICAWSMLVEPNLLLKKRYQLALREGAKQTLRVAVLADLHIGAPQHGLRQLQRIVHTSNELKPDLVLLAGDYLYRGPVGRNVTASHLGPALGKLRARLGVFAVLGNHDNATGARQMRQALESAGIEVLENAHAALDLQGKRLNIIGVSDFWTTHLKLDRAFRGVSGSADLNLVLTHNPDVFPELQGRPFDLAIAGHTHGGQVRLPLIGLLYTPSRYGERFLQGFVFEESGRFFISPGVGMSILPIRFGRPPEISVLELDF